MFPRSGSPFGPGGCFAPVGMRGEANGRFMMVTPVERQRPFEVARLDHRFLAGRRSESCCRPGRALSAYTRVFDALWREPGPIATRLTRVHGVWVPALRGDDAENVACSLAPYRPAA